MTVKPTKLKLQHSLSSSFLLPTKRTIAYHFAPLEKIFRSYTPPCPKTTIQEVLSIDYTTPLEAVETLHKNSFISKAEISNLHSMLKKTGLPQEKTIIPKALYAQAIAIKNALSQTHFTFLHAQATCGIALSYATKELMKTKICPSLLQDYEFLRSPNITSSQSIEMYRDSSTTHDTDPHTENDLLSVDAYFYNTEIEESALYYLATNSNAGNFSKKIHNAVQQVFEQFYPAASKDKIEEASNKLMGEISMIDAPCGNLYTLSIPKEEVQKIVYRAHPFGKACTCHEKEQDEQILTNLQNGKICRKTRCQGTLSIPQYRMFTQELLKIGENRHIYCLSPLLNSQKTKIRDVIKDILINLRHK